MSNLLVDPSFENNDPLWLAADEIVGGSPYDPFTTTFARKGVQSGLLRQADANDNAIISQDVTFPATVEAGELLFMGIWARATDANSGTLLLGFELGYSPMWVTLTAAGILTYLDPITGEVFRTATTLDPVADWVPIPFNMQAKLQITPSTPNLTYAVFISPSGSAGSHWYVDDAYLSITDPFPVPIREPHSKGPIQFQRNVSDVIHGTIHKEGRVTRDFDHKLRRRDEVKFVIAGRDDYDFARSAVASRRLGGRCAVIFSPVKDQCDLAELAGWILSDRLDVRLGIQLHKVIWPNKDKGV